MSKPDIKRFWKYLNDEVAIKDRRFTYGEGSFDGDDAQAFIDGVKAMAEHILSGHQAQMNFINGFRDKPKYCDCTDCKFAREILKVDYSDYAQSWLNAHPDKAWDDVASPLIKCAFCGDVFNSDAEGHQDATGLSFCDAECENQYDWEIGLPDEYKRAYE
jgi:hypothetical protein